MRFMSKQDITASTLELPYEDVHVPELGEDAYVRVGTLTAMERSQYQAGLFRMTPDGKTRELTLEGADVRLVTLALRDPDTNERLFDAADIEIVGAVDARVIDRLVPIARRLAGIGKQDVEEIVGNSGGIPSDASASSSPEISESHSGSSSTPSEATS